MIEATLVCDECGRIIDAAPKADVVRRAAYRQELYRKRQGRDICCHYCPIKKPAEKG